MRQGCKDKKDKLSLSRTLAVKRRKDMKPEAVMRVVDQKAFPLPQNGGDISTFVLVGRG